MKGITRGFLVSLGIPTVFFPGLILAAVLGWNWPKDLGRLREAGGYKGAKIIFPQEGKVAEVIDGDTFVLENGQTVRMIGIDAPNRGEAGHEEAQKYLTDLIDGETVGLEYDSYQDDKFGRILAYVWESCSASVGCRDGRRMLNLTLVREGKAKVVFYEDRRKLRYEKELREAENSN